MADDYDTQTEEATPAPPEGAQPNDPTLVVDEGTKKFITQWTKRIKAAKEHKKIKKAFERARRCQDIAAYGSDDKAWIDNDLYSVPIINRHVNQSVATLYGKNPTAIAKRKQKLLYKIWDGDPASLQAAMMAMQQAMTLPPVMDPMTGQIGPQVDPNAMALLAEVQAAKQQLVMYERLGKTMGLLFDYYLQENGTNFRKSVKAAIRRTKVNGIAYSKLNFQRLLEKNPEIVPQLEDATDQLARIEALMKDSTGEEWEADSAQAAELKILLADLQSKLEIIVREGPIWSFPRSTDIIFDPNTRDITTFEGTGWLAHEFDLTRDEILETYKVDVKNYTEYTADGKEAKEGADKEDCHARVWEVEWKNGGQFFTVCDGYPDFLRPPAEPNTKIERFWTIFPLVFNAVEHDDEVIPPSDVWNTRHMQREYNTTREALREHRIAARPRYMAPKGKLDEVDKDNLRSSVPHSITEVNAIAPGESVEQIIQRVPVANIDPNLYETETAFVDIQRSVGTQEANLGGTSGATATESSIAENSRMTSSADNVDDLDNWLTDMMRSMGQLMLLELDMMTVQEICGPGAVWPEQPPTREQIAKDLILEVEAGSSGRPNKAADLADLERAMPFVIQLPGFNPMPLAKRYGTLLNIDPEDTVVEGQPSIMALNQMAGTNLQAGADPESDPNQQGDKGGDNAAQPGQNEPGPQPAFPTPAPGPGI